MAEKRAKKRKRAKADPAEPYLGRPSRPATYVAPVGEYWSYLNSTRHSNWPRG
jgi:hypothetical protein